MGLPDGWASASTSSKSAERAGMARGRALHRRRPADGGCAARFEGPRFRRPAGDRGLCRPRDRSSRIQEGSSRPDQSFRGGRREESRKGVRPSSVLVRLRRPRHSPLPTPNRISEGRSAERDLCQSAAVSTSCRMRSRAMRRPAKLTSVSASASWVDQRAPAKGRAGRRGDRRQASSRRPPRDRTPRGRAKCAKRRTNVGGTGVRDVAADDSHEAETETAEDAIHAAPEIAAALTQARHATGSGTGLVRRDRQHGTESAVAVRPRSRRVRVARETARPPDHRCPCQAPLDRPETGARANTTTVSFIRRSGRLPRRHASQ